MTSPATNRSRAPLSRRSLRGPCPEYWNPSFSLPRGAGTDRPRLPARGAEPDRLLGVLRLRGGEGVVPPGHERREVFRDHLLARPADLRRGREPSSVCLCVSVRVESRPGQLEHQPARVNVHRFGDSRDRVVVWQRVGEQRNPTQAGSAKPIDTSPPHESNPTRSQRSRRRFRHTRTPLRSQEGMGLLAQIEAEEVFAWAPRLRHRAQGRSSRVDDWPTRGRDIAALAIPGQNCACLERCPDTRLARKNRK
jgi:hypothetical protein